MSNTPTRMHKVALDRFITIAAAAMVWDGTAAVSKAPLDNKSCLFKNLAGVMAVLKDTSREVRAAAG